MPGLAPDSDLRLTVKLTPRAARNAITGWAEDATGARYLKVSVTAVPEKGKANEALIELLAEEWGLPRNQIGLIKGASSRVKILLLTGLSEARKREITNCK